MDPWLLLFNENEVDRFAGAFRAAMLVKVLDKDTSPSCHTASSFICLIPILFVTMILVYKSSLSKRPISVSSSLNQVASFAARANATYSAFVDEKATVACIFEHQLTGPPFCMKMKPNVNFLVTWSSALSESK